MSQQTANALSVENEYCRYTLDQQARSVEFVDKRSRTNYCDSANPTPFARLRKNGVDIPATQVSGPAHRMKVLFGNSGITAEFSLKTLKRHFVLELLSISDQQIEELTLIDLPLKLRATAEEPFVACSLARNLKTNVLQLPQPSKHLLAQCYPRFGLVGASVAIIGCPAPKLREVMKLAVESAPDLPHSRLGGPWAMESPDGRGSYLFNFGSVTEQSVDEWITVIKALGFNQLDFHGGTSFRFGDCEPNKDMYPNGFASLKAVIDRLHRAGIKAGLHTYAFFIDKKCPWVTPVPDKRLATDAVLTLSNPISADTVSLTTDESTAAMLDITGFQTRNSVTVRIEDELITYTASSKAVPWGFTGCTRGAHGTKATPHPAGAKVYHLKECFGLFVPDGDSTLYTEVAAKTAEAYNACGFDMIYLDALDGEDILAGSANGWHYGSKFVFEIAKRLKRPALMEMSTFHHHLWYLRSRLGAWDHPNRSHRRFIDMHCKDNEAYTKMFMPAQLGWWAAKGWTSPDTEPTFTDDIEYLTCKALSTDTGLSLMGIDPVIYKAEPGFARLAGIFKKYEELRHAHKLPAAVLGKLAVPGAEHTLSTDRRGKSSLSPVSYSKHKVTGSRDGSTEWTVTNSHEPQPLKLRIEALMSAAAYDSPESVVLLDPSLPASCPVRDAAPAVTISLAESTLQPVAGLKAVELSAVNAHTEREGSWAYVGSVFTPWRDISARRALGVWVHGDGKGELLNFQLKSPEHISAAIGEHYLTVDFTGWRYVELIETEGDRWLDYQWPYGWAYSIFRESVDFAGIENLRIWVNNLPANGGVSCHLSAVKALPLMPARIIYPSITLGRQTITFPVELPSGSYLELISATECKLYGPEGQFIRDIKPVGGIPTLKGGVNKLSFKADADGALSTRANVTVISQGKPIWTER